MKLFVKLMLAILVLGLLLPFTILKGKDGNTLMNFKDFSLPDISLPDFPDGKDISTSIDSGKKDIFYKWYDDEGNVQFTTEPPADGIEYTTRGYDPNANVIQAVKVPREEPEEEQQPSSKKGPESSNETPNPYSQESIEKLFKDAESIENLLNQRIKDQESAINQ